MVKKKKGLKILRGLCVRNEIPHGPIEEDLPVTHNRLLISSIAGPQEEKPSVTLGLGNQGFLTAQGYDLNISPTGELYQTAEPRGLYSNSSTR